MIASRSFATPTGLSLKAMIFGATCALVLLGIAHATSYKSPSPAVVTLERVVVTGSRVVPQQLPTVVITGRRNTSADVAQ